MVNKNILDKEKPKNLQELADFMNGYYTTVMKEAVAKTAVISANEAIKLLYEKYLKDEENVEGLVQEIKEKCQKMEKEN